MFDKGNAVVILNTVDYTEKALLFWMMSHKKLAKDPTQSTEQKTTLLLKGSSPLEDVTEQLP
jgi:hypothetical protein